ncbi:MAG TPA: uracil phosphoribosyltransferase [Anaeromyxobacteraceae bacterium]|nr:uracil phosphoribosyltransferase [Anaeromyxobacteraceae bacterium]
MRDLCYQRITFCRSEIEHRYGSNVHILANPYLLSQLARLCAKETTQPAINRLVVDIYGRLLEEVMNAEFPRVVRDIPTRMVDVTPAGVFRGEIIDPGVRAVTVNIARAGAVPSQTVYDLLNVALDPRRVRQDHLIMSRMLGEHEEVVGAGISGMKIGGDVEDAFLLFPDPMGATGSSLSEAIRTYKTKVPGRPRCIVNVHLIVTPEYLRRMTREHPEVLIYAVRVDRGLSPPEVLATVPGTRWDQEQGLTAQQYIVPGGGGFGEIMNNAYV